MLRAFRGYKLKEKPRDECYMEITTHVLTTTQNLTDAQKTRVRGNIGAASQADLGQTESLVQELNTIVSSKAEKVTGATNGNFAELNGNGDLTDSGYKAADFATSAQGALADTAYQKPDDGIPDTDLTASVQSTLGKADTAYQKPDDGIPSTDLTASVQESLGKADSAYQLPYDGIPTTDVNSTIRESLGKANTAYQKPVDGIPDTDLTASVQTSLGKADTALQSQDIEGKEDVLNKVTLWTNEPSDINYPSEKLVKDSLDNKVTSVSGKGLSSNDYSDADKNKLANISDGAQSNIIETIKVNGTALIPSEKSVDIDLSGYKTVQEAVSDPEASGNGVEFINAISQDTNGVITAHKKHVKAGTTSNAGIVQLEDSHESTSTTTAATPNSVKEAYDLAAGKQDPISFEGTYDASNNKAATESTVSNATANLATKVTSATSGNFAGLDSNGDLVDSNSKAADFATSTQGAKADSAIQGISLNGSELSPDGTQKINLGNLKPTQSPITTDPEEDGHGLTFVDSVKQNANGVINVHRKSVPYGSTSQYGVVQLHDAIDSTSVTSAATPNSVKTAYDLAASSIKGVQLNGTDLTPDSNKKVNVTVNNATLKVKLGSGTAVDVFSADASTDATIEIPSAAYGQSYVEGLMAGQEKEKLSGIASGADVNVLESVTIEDDSTALPISSKNVIIPKASYTTGTTPSYTTGVISGQDKKLLDTIEANAQVNLIEHVKIEGESDDLTITSKRVTIPLAASATDDQVAAAKSGLMSASDKDKLDSVESGAQVNVLEGVKLAGESTQLSPTDKVVTIPNVVASVSASGGTSGLMTATDKEKLDGIASGAQVNVLESISVNGVAKTITNKGVDIDVPVVDTTYNASSLNPQSGTAVAYAISQHGNVPTPSETDANKVLKAYVSDPSTTPKTMSYKWDVADSGLPSKTSSDDGKVLTVINNGASLTWESLPTVDQTYDGTSAHAQSGVAVASAIAGVDDVPVVTSGDNGKVLKATYSGGTGSYAWGDAPGLFEAVYGTTTYAEIAAAVAANKMLYCKVAVSDNPSPQYRMAHLAYIIPTGFEFQYYRSVSPKDADNQGDEIFVYKVDNTDVWTTTTRKAYTKIVAGTNMSSSYSDGTLTLNATIPSVDEVPTVESVDDGKVLKASYSSGVGSYSWVTDEVGPTYTAGTGIDISAQDVLSVKIDGSTVTTNSSGELTAIGEVNTVETVKVNGSALTPDANKAVDVEVPSIKLEGAASSLAPSSHVITIPNAVATGETGATNGLVTSDDKKTLSHSVIYKENPTTGAEALLAQRLYVVRSDQEIINIISGGGAEGQGTILFRIG